MNRLELHVLTRVHLKDIMLNEKKPHKLQNRYASFIYKKIMDLKVWEILCLCIPFELTIKNKISVRVVWFILKIKLWDSLPPSGSGFF